jgi:hypothetical protein
MFAVNQILVRSHLNLFRILLFYFIIKEYDICIFGEIINDAFNFHQFFI